jgi:hypothetical protein
VPVLFSVTLTGGVLKVAIGEAELQESYFAFVTSSTLCALNWKLKTRTSPTLKDLREAQDV